MYWTSIISYLSWPVFIIISYFVIVFILKKVNLYHTIAEENNPAPAENKT